MRDHKISNKQHRIDTPAPIEVLPHVKNSPVFAGNPDAATNTASSLTPPPVPHIKVSKRAEQAFISMQTELSTVVEQLHGDISTRNLVQQFLKLHIQCSSDGMQSLTDLGDLMQHISASCTQHAIAQDKLIQQQLQAQQASVQQLDTMHIAGMAIAEAGMCVAAGFLLGPAVGVAIGCWMFAGYLAAGSHVFSSEQHQPFDHLAGLQTAGVIGLGCMFGLLCTTPYSTAAWQMLQWAIVPTLAVNQLYDAGKTLLLAISQNDIAQQQQDVVFTQLLAEIAKKDHDIVQNLIKDTATSRSDSINDYRKLLEANQQVLQQIGA